MFTSLGCLLPCLCYSSFICSSHLSFIWSCLHFHTLFILQLAQLPLILACCFWIGPEISWSVYKFTMYHYVTSCFLLTSWIHLEYPAFPLPKSFPHHLALWRPRDLPFRGMALCQGARRRQVPRQRRCQWCCRGGYNTGHRRRPCWRGVARGGPAWDEGLATFKVLRRTYFSKDLILVF